jgi:DNA (cytosine-5)-methyltransferase 1
VSRRVQRPPQVRLYADEIVIDGFAGGGGTSTGIEAALGRSPDIAINHDPVALAMHEVNHPDTRHVQSNIREVSYRKESAGRPVGIGWFSPDCTHHSKARGGKPFRDRNRARRIRGLAWEAVRCAEEVRPRILIIENVEEFKEWGPLDADGCVIARKKGSSFRRWVARLRKQGYAVEWRELRACDFGAPTSRKRLFVVARCDGQPIVWPKRTHGPGRRPFRTAAECIDFRLPVPSIFLTPRQARAWGKAHGVAAPKRPLAKATKRRIARGTWRYVIDTTDPFIIRYNSEHGQDVRGQRLDRPLTTLDTSNRFALVAPFLAAVRHQDDSHLPSVEEPIRTIPASDREFALVAPLLINTRNGERKGQAPRVHDIRQPFNTITAQGSQGALVAAFLAKHNAGHEATGQKLERPIDTVTTRDSKALVTSHLVKLRGGHGDHVHTDQDVRQPAPTLTAGGTHLAEIRTTLVTRDSIDAEYLDRAVETCAFLVKFFGTGVARPINQPASTLTTNDRIGLVTVILVNVGGTERVLVDIGMRMLTPRELFLCQGFPASYEIDRVTLKTALGFDAPAKLTKKAQTRLVGNSVPPVFPEAIIAANCARPKRRRAA